MSAVPQGDRCPNCDATLTARFCAECGQRRPRRVEAWRLAREAVAALLDVDGPWLRTVRDLTLRPGEALRAYLAGARKRYVNPMLYLVGTATVYLFAVHALGVDLLAAQGLPETARANYELILRLLGYLGLLGALLAAWVLGPLWRATTVGERYVVLIYTYGHVALLKPLLFAAGLPHLPHWAWIDRLLVAAWFGFVFARLRGDGWHKGLGLGLLAYVLMALGVFLAGGVVVALRQVALHLLG